MFVTVGADPIHHCCDDNFHFSFVYLFFNFHNFRHILRFKNFASAFVGGGSFVSNLMPLR